MKIQNHQTELNLYTGSPLERSQQNALGQAHQSESRLAESLALLEVTPENAATALRNVFDSQASGLTRLQEMMGTLECSQSLGRSLPDFDWRRHHQALKDSEVIKTPLQRPGDPRNWTQVQPPGGDSYAFTSEKVEGPDDGKGAWTEVVANGRRYLTREYTEDGVHWVEYIEDGNRYRYVNGGSKGITDQVRSEGCRPITVEGQTVLVFGKLEEWEVNVLQQAIADMPSPARAHLKELFVAPRLGEVMQPDGSGVQQVAGMGGPGLVILQKGLLASPKAIREILFHEAGHGFDQSHRPPLSSRPPWGDENSVSPYGRRSASEDFAEVHAAVLSKWDDLSRLDAVGWSRETCWQKKHEIFTAYGGQAPSLSAILAVAS